MLSIWRLIPTQVAILAASCLPGCISIAWHSYELVDVPVLDAETSDPLSNARVSISYGHHRKHTDPQTAIQEPIQPNCRTAAGACATTRWIWRLRLTFADTWL